MNFADKKPILAIETSGELCSAAVYFDQYKFAEVNLRLKHVHSEKIIDIIDEVLKQVQLQFSDLSSIAISSGPGSFTGLRIGMSAVKGLALGSGLPLIAVPTFEALAYQICTYLPVGTEFFIANKVNLEEVYNAKFRKVLDGYEFIDKLSVTWNEEFENRLNDKSLLFGNFIPGNTAVSACSVSWPSASSVARWAYKFGKDSLTYDYDFLEPFYLKNFVIKEHK